MAGLTPLGLLLSCFAPCFLGYLRQLGISSGCSSSMERDSVKFIRQRSGCLISGCSERFLQNGCVRLERVLAEVC